MAGRSHESMSRSLSLLFEGLCRRISDGGVLYPSAAKPQEKEGVGSFTSGKC